MKGLKTVFLDELHTCIGNKKELSYAVPNIFDHYGSLLKNARKLVLLRSMQKICFKLEMQFGNVA